MKYKLKVLSRVAFLQISRVKGKDKMIPLHAMEALGMRGGIAPTHS
jgi:hypothetical protein